MELFTNAQKSLLLANGHPDNRDRDHAPVVKLVLPGTGCIWLLSEIDPDDPDIAFGLCDLGLGFPELGSVSVSELQSLCFWEGMPVMRDEQFAAQFPMSVFVDAAWGEQAITDDQFALQHAAARIQSRRSRNAPRPQ